MFGIAESLYGPVHRGTLEELSALRESKRVKELCERAERGDDGAKKMLPVWTPSCAEFKGNRRLSANAIAPTGRLMLDFDQKGHSQEILTRCKSLQEEGKWDILLVEESARRGTHVLITLPHGMTAKQAQKEFSADVGFEADPSLKDIARCIYIVPQDHVLMDRMACGEKTRQAIDKAQGTVDQSSQGTSASQSQLRIDEAPKPRENEVGEATERGLRIFDKAREIAGLNDVDIDERESHSRHNNLTSILSIGICRLMKKEEMKGVVRKRMPGYAEEHDCMTLIDDFYNNYTQMNAPMSRELRRVLSETAETNSKRQLGPCEMDSMEGPSGMHTLMPKRLPSLIELLVSKTPEEYREAVACAVFPPLGAHLCGVKFRYIDNVDHEATLMNVLMAPTGSGKSCVNAPINAIMKDIRVRDRENLAREREWKKQMSAKMQSKEGVVRPDDIIVQEVDPDMTNAAFVLRLSEAKGHFLYAMMNEIEQFDSLKTSSRSMAQFQIMCLSFDPDNQYGQTRVGIGSICERVTIRFNWNASTTIKKGKSYFANVLTDGPVSRINFSTLAERPIGAPLPVFGIYDKKFDDDLAEYIERLNNAHGRIRCEEAEMLAAEMLEEDQKIAISMQSRTYENLSRRANVIAYLKGMVLYVAEGMRWSREIEDFVRWSKRRDMELKMEFFGESIEEAERNEGHQIRRGPRNMLSLMPEMFSTEEFVRVYRHQGMMGDAQSLLRMWKKRGLIDGTPERWQKSI